ncbi:hypothetical protein FXB40_36925 [Bradyrhizobium rifense]|uniref:Quinol:cytochrome C oxidoreductase n=1 Tax=Bradyrhizobium rifense TaxID=515499 RepID=A0A5D3KEJ9_9BRAD|nr:hypothetical protein [Bradyrhizobium rifense]TYL89172.1 hypothetical protein FXB40_36925 [Bradyrhizobium rifense]
MAWIGLGAIPIGALGVQMTSYLVQRAWTHALYATLAAATAVLPVAALLFTPVLIGMKELYPAATDASSLPAFKAVYLAPWFFALRSIVYFVILALLALWQRSTWGEPQRMIRSASAGLIVYALLVSWAGVDWMESLEPEFHSSIYGLLFLCFTLLSGTSFGIGAALLSGRRIGATRGYSALLLSTILLWAYLHAMQYIVIWAANLPDEVTWYLKRSSGGWPIALAILALGQFVFPFLALLSGRVRADPTWLLGLCGLTLVMRWLEAAVLTLPAIPHIELLTVGLLLVPALAFIGITLWWSFEVAEQRNSMRAWLAPGAHAETGSR